MRRLVNCRSWLKNTNKYQSSILLKWAILQKRWENMKGYMELCRIILIVCYLLMLKWKKNLIFLNSKPEKMLWPSNKKTILFHLWKINSEKQIYSAPMLKKDTWLSWTSSRRKLLVRKIILKTESKRCRIGKDKFR